MKFLQNLRKKLENHLIGIVATAALYRTKPEDNPAPGYTAVREQTLNPNLNTDTDEPYYKGQRRFEKTLFTAYDISGSFHDHNLNGTGLNPDPSEAPIPDSYDRVLDMLEKITGVKKSRRFLIEMIEVDGVWIKKENPSRKNPIYSF